jgi:hypothetical protein
MTASLLALLLAPLAVMVAFVLCAALAVGALVAVLLAVHRLMEGLEALAGLARRLVAQGAGTCEPLAAPDADPDPG